MEVSMPKELQIKPVFVKTQNVRRFEGVMESLPLSDGEGRLVVIWSKAGRGKTRTVQRHAAHSGCVYLRCLSIWRHSELGFLQALCRELGVRGIPHRKDQAFTEALNVMVAKQKPLFLDEIEKLPYLFLELVRDLCDLSGAPIILVGEEELVSVLRRNRRMWSRAYRQLEFENILAADIITYANQVAGVRLNMETTELLRQSSDGDFRLVKRDLINLVVICNANNTDEPTAEMVRVAIKRSLS
jgi:DNA transposition AAA+ family ATPase